MMMMMMGEYKIYRYTLDIWHKNLRQEPFFHKLTVAQQVKKYFLLLKIQYRVH
jgi:hypothetical protein